jgi:hypothetical protein
MGWRETLPPCLGVLVPSVVVAAAAAVAFAGPLAPLADITDAPEALQQTLVRAGWTMTPERSATYAVGDIYSATDNRVVAFGADCFSVTPREGVYTSFDVVQALKVGGRVPLGVARGHVDGMQYKQVTFAEPYVTELSDMMLVPAETCASFLRARTDLHELYVIQAVLSAEVKEQLCRELDAGVASGGLGVSGGARQECAQGSEGHVAVAVKTRSVAEMLGIEEEPVSPAVAEPEQPPPTPTAAVSGESLDAFLTPASDRALLVITCAEPTLYNVGLRSRVSVSDGAVFGIGAWTATAHSIDPGPIDVGLKNSNERISLVARPGEALFVLLDTESASLILLNFTMREASEAEARERLAKCDQLVTQ